jgi:hypothetical protein
MPQKMRHRLVSVRDLLATAGPLLVLLLLLLALAYWVLDPTPPRSMVLATGSQRGAYAEFGARYAQCWPRTASASSCATRRARSRTCAAARSQVRGRRRVRAGRRRRPGAVERGRQPRPALARQPVLRAGVAVLPRGLRRAAGEVACIDEPVAARRAGASIGGTDGSGARLLLQQLLEVNAIDLKSLTLLKDDTTPAVVSFLEGRCDAIVFVSAPESLMVQMLLRTPGVQLFDFAQSEAYARRLPFLSAVVLPRGIVDLARDQPPHEVRMIAPTAILVAREGTHPALLQLLVQAAATGARRRRLVPAQGRFSEHAQHRDPDLVARRRASTATASRSCSATCRSGWPT